MSAEIVPLGFAGEGTFDERGLLGAAFHPDYAVNGLLYAYTSEPEDGGVADFPVPEGAAADHHSVIAEWQVASPGLAPDSADPDSLADHSSKRELLRIGQPQFNHDGGAVSFGPTDGMLYISLGDGGSANDEADGHTAGLGAANDGSICAEAGLVGMEDQFDGTWYGYYFEYQDDADGALQEFFRYDLTPEQVEECRQAFEPPFDCSL